MHSSYFSFFSLYLLIVSCAGTNKNDDIQTPSTSSPHIMTSKTIQLVGKTDEPDQPTKKQEKLVKKSTPSVIPADSKLVQLLLDVITKGEPDSTLKLISQHGPIEVFRTLVDIVLKNPSIKEDATTVRKMVELCCDGPLLEYAMKRAIRANCEILASIVSEISSTHLTEMAVIVASILNVLPKFRKENPIDESVLKAALIFQSKIVKISNTLRILSTRLPEPLFEQITQNILPGSTTFAGAMWHKDLSVVESFSLPSPEYLHSKLYQLVLLLNPILPNASSSMDIKTNFVDVTYEFAYYLDLIDLDQCLDGLAPSLSLVHSDYIIGSFLGDQLIADLQSLLPYMPSLSDTHRVYGYVPSDVISLATSDFFSPSRSARILLHNMYLQSPTDSSIKECLIDMMTIHMTSYLESIVLTRKGVSTLDLIYSTIPISSSRAFYAGYYKHAMIAKVKRNSEDSFDVILINSDHVGHDYHKKIVVGSRTLYVPYVYMPSLSLDALRSASYHYAREESYRTAFKIIYVNYKSHAQLGEPDDSEFIASQASGTCGVTSIIQYLHSSGKAIIGLRMKLAIISHVIDLLSVSYSTYLRIQAKEQLSVSSLKERWDILRGLDVPTTYERYIWYRPRYILIISDALINLLLEYRNRPTFTTLIVDHWDHLVSHNLDSVDVQQINENVRPVVDKFRPSQANQTMSSDAPIELLKTEIVSKAEPDILFAEEHAKGFAEDIIKACDPFNVIECFKAMISAMPYADYKQVIDAVCTISYPLTKWTKVPHSIAYVFMIHLKMARLKNPVKSFPFASLLLPSSPSKSTKEDVPALEWIEDEEDFDNLAVALSSTHGSIWEDAPFIQLIYSEASLPIILYHIHENHVQRRYLWEALLSSLDKQCPTIPHINYLLMSHALLYSQPLVLDILLENNYTLNIDYSTFSKSTDSSSIRPSDDAFLTLLAPDSNVLTIATSFYFAYGPIGNIITILLNSPPHINYTHDALKKFVERGLKIKSNALYKYFKRDQTLPPAIKETLGKVIIFPSKQSKKRSEGGMTNIPIDALSPTSIPPPPPLQRSKTFIAGDNG